MEIPSNITQSYLQDGTNFYSFYQEIKIQPEKMPQQTSETIKFIFTTSPNIYINTQTFQLEFDIQIEPSQTFGCNLILDGSGQSLISEIKLEVNAQIIEQVVKYDIVSSQLEHMGIGPMSKQHRYYFGFCEDSHKSQFLDQFSGNVRNADQTMYDRNLITSTTSETLGSLVPNAKQANTGSCVAFMPYDVIPKSLQQAPDQLETNLEAAFDQANQRHYFKDLYTHPPRKIYFRNGKYQIPANNYGRPSGYYGWSRTDDVQSLSKDSIYVPNIEYMVGMNNIAYNAALTTATTYEQNILTGDRINQVVFPNLNFTQDGNLTAQAIESYKVQRGFAADGVMRANTFLPVGFTRHRPEAVEFLLSGSGGIQGPHSYLLVNHVDAKVRIQDQKNPLNNSLIPYALSKVGRVDTNMFDPAPLEGSLTGYNTHGSEAVSMYGYQVISSNLTSKFAKNLHLSGDHYQYWLKEGRVMHTPVKTNRLKVFVPLNSAIMGQLNQKYMPGSCMGRMVLHVTLNKYAFFLSGISNKYDGWDIPNAVALQTVQVKRWWQFANVQLIMEGYRFGQVQNDQLQQRLTGGILNNNLQAYQAGEYVIPNTASLSSNWNLTCRIPAVRLITMAIYSNDYINYTFCRKLFRLSGNITKLRLRITDTYLPQDPISGHAGNPVNFSSTDDSNINFLVWLHKSLAVYKDNQAYCPFNNVNIAINDRAFNPDIYTYPRTADNDQEAKACQGCKHLWYGQTGILEQSYYGMALYLWAFGQQPMMPQSNVGLDTRNLDIFYVEIQSDTTTLGNNRPQTIVFTAFADYIYRVYQRNIVVMGK